MLPRDESSGKRIMTLEELSPQKRLSVGRQAVRLVLARLRKLALQTLAGDPPLYQLFNGLAGDVEKILVEIGRFESQGGSPDLLPESEGQGIARGFLPSLQISSGGANVDRESGIYLSECMGKDLVGLFETLGRQSCDAESKAFYLRSKQAVEARLEFLRHVLL
jgi:hypothetical protein